MTTGTAFPAETPKAIYAGANSATVTLDLSNAVEGDGVKAIATGTYNAEGIFTATSVKIVEADGVTLNKNYKLPAGFVAKTITGEIEVVAATPTVTVTPSAQSVTVGQSVTLRAMVKGVNNISLTGEVTFQYQNADGETVELATVPCNGGTASLVWNDFNAGDVYETIVATFTPTAKTVGFYNAATSAACARIVINMAMPAALRVVLAQPTLEYGDTYNVSELLSTVDGSETGAVTYQIVKSDIASLSNDGTTLTANQLGATQVWAKKEADGNYYTCTSANTNFTVVAKSLDETVINMPENAQAKYLSPTTATLVLETLADGTQVIATGRYDSINCIAGDYNFTATSIKVVEANGVTVSKNYKMKPGFVVGSVAGKVGMLAADSNVTVTANKITAPYGTPVIITAMVKGVNNSTAGMNGTVTFKNGETVLETANCLNGRATLTVTDFEVGDYTQITAEFAPADSIQANYNGATSAACKAFTITKAAAPATIVKITQPKLAYGEEVALATLLTLTGGSEGEVTYHTVNPAVATVENGKLVATGIGTTQIYITKAESAHHLAYTSARVNVTVAAKQLETVTFPADASGAEYINATTANLTLDVTGLVAGDTTTKVIAMGRYDAANIFTATSVKIVGADGVTISRNYTLPTGFVPSRDLETGEIDFVNVDPAVSVTASRTSLPYNTPVTFTAMVKGINNIVAGMNGTVTFKNGETVLETVNCLNGRATFTTKELMAGDYDQITATFTPDSVSAAHYNAETSAPCSQVRVTPAVSPALRLTLKTTRILYGTTMVIDDTFATTVGGNGSVIDYYAVDNAVLAISAPGHETNEQTVTANKLGATQVFVSQQPTADYAGTSSAKINVTVVAKPLDRVFVPADAQADYINASTVSVELGADGIVNGDDIKVIATGRYVAGTFTATSVKITEADGVTLNRNYTLPVGFVASKLTGSVTLAPATPVVTLTPNRVSAPFGTAVTLSARAVGLNNSPAGIAGTITFKNDGVTIATVACTNGVANTLVKDFAVGTHANLTAEYTPAAAANYTVATSAACKPVVITKLNAPATTIRTTLPRMIYGDSAALSDIITLTGGSTGAVTYYTVNPAVATIQDGKLIATGVGTTQIYITKEATDTYLPYTSVKVNVTVTAKQLSGLSIPENAVAEYLTATTAQLELDIAGLVADDTTTKVIATGRYTAGTFTATAVKMTEADGVTLNRKYTLTVGFIASKLTGEATLAPATPVVTLAANRASAPFGTAITLTARVVGLNNSPAGLNGVITFKDGDTTLATVQCNNGVASKMLTDFAVGTYTSLTAEFTPNMPQNYTAATSAACKPVVITKLNAPATTIRSTLPRMVYGDSAALSDIITLTGGSTGAVTYHTVNPAVATIENGKLIATGVGTTQIYITKEATDTYLPYTSARVSVTVTAKQLTSVSIPENAWAEYLTTTTAMVALEVEGLVSPMERTCVIATGRYDNEYNFTATSVQILDAAGNINRNYILPVGFVASKLTGNVELVAAQPQITLTANKTTAPAGAPITVTAMVKLANGSVSGVNGLVALTDADGNLIQAQSAVNGRASFTLKDLPVGENELTACFASYTEAIESSDYATLTVTVG